MPVANFSMGHSGRADWRSACDECLAQLGSMAAAEPEATDQSHLGFVYVTDAFGPSLGAIVNHLRAETGVQHWVGSVGLGICASGIEYFGAPAIAVLVGGLPPDSFRVFDGVKEDLTAFETTHGTWCDAHAAFFAMVHADPNNTALPGLIELLSARLGGGTGGFLVGGLASAETSMVQVANGLTSGGLSGVVLSPEVSVTTRLSQGCAPIGPRREITRAEQNIIVEIDGRPALEVLNEDIGEILARDLRRAAGYIFAGLPIQGSDTGDYLVRNLVGVDPRNGVIAIGELVSPGQRIMFCRRDAPSAAADMSRMLAELSDAIDGAPQAGVYYSCLARGPNLFGPNSEEVKMISETFADLPLVGFFANGEISHHRLYAYTGVLTLFG